MRPYLPTIPLSQINPSPSFGDSASEAQQASDSSSNPRTGDKRMSSDLTSLQPPGKRRSTASQVAHMIGFQGPDPTALSKLQTEASVRPSLVQATPFRASVRVPPGVVRSGRVPAWSNQTSAVGSVSPDVTPNTSALSSRGGKVPPASSGQSAREEKRIGRIRRTTDEIEAFLDGGRNKNVKLTGDEKTALRKLGLYLTSKDKSLQVVVDYVGDDVAWLQEDVSDWRKLPRTHTYACNTHNVTSAVTRFHAMYKS